MATSKARSRTADAEETGETDTDDETPEDLNAAVITLEWGGQTFTIPKRRGRWPVKALRELGRSKWIEGLAILLGEKQWDALALVCPTGDEFDTFANYAAEQVTEHALP